MIKHLQHAAHHAKRFLHGAYHGTRKTFMQNVDMGINMTRRLLAASQPMLQDLGVQDQIMRPVMQGLSRYDQAKTDVLNIHGKAEDHYARIADVIQ